MADVKISELTAQASANVDVSADVLALVDTSATQTKKISVENLLSPITIDKSAGTITSLGTVTGSFQANGGAVFNEGSADVDFRVESNDSANMLFVDGGNNKVLIEANNTDSVTDAATMIAASALEVNGNAGEGSDILRIGAMADASGGYFLEASNGAGNASYNLLLNPINGGRVGIGGVTSPEDKLHIAGTSATVSDTQLVLEGRYGGYGAGINFVSRTSNGGTNVSMAKITADGEAAFDTTAANQDAGLRFFTTLNGSSAEAMRITSGNLLQINQNNAGSAGTSNKSLSLGGAVSTQFDATNVGTFTGIVVSNSYGDSNNSGQNQAGTATGIAFGHHASSSGISYVVSKAGSENGDRSSLHFGTRGSDGVNERMVIMDNSYVGIGTNNPTEKLTVTGGDILVDSARGVRANGGNEMIRFDNTNGVRINSGGKNVVSFKRDSSILHHGAGTNVGMELYKHTSGTDPNLLFTVVLNNASGLYHLTVCEIIIAHIGNANPRAVSKYIWEIENHNSFASDRPAIQTPVLVAGDSQSITVNNPSADTATFQINYQVSGTSNTAAYFRVVSGVTGVSSLT